MAVTDSFTEFVVDQLSGCGPITPKKMFGGVGVYCRDVFFAILSNDLLYLKVDDSNRGDFEAAGKGPFRPYGDDTEVMQYYQVPLAVLEDADELVRWARKAIAVAVHKRGTRRTRSKARRTRSKARRTRSKARSSRSSQSSRRKPRSLRGR